MSDKDKGNDKEEEYYFKVWKSYEKVAMHFNDLIVRLRIQSLGGLAALAVILGIFLNNKGQGNESFNYSIATIALLILMGFWIAIWVLDMCYYNRLLEGSVNAILELEKDKGKFLKKKEIKLSTNIEMAFRKRFQHEPKKICERVINGRNCFYLIVLVMLLIAFQYSYIKTLECKSSIKTSPTPIPQKNQAKACDSNKLALVAYKDLKSFGK